MRMEDTYRSPSAIELTLLKKLLERDFPGRDNLLRQLDGLSVKTIDEEGSLSIQVDPLAPRRARKGFVPNLQIGSCLQAEIDNVNGLAAGLAQCLCERRRKLRVDQKGQSLFRCDNGMVRLPGGKGQNRIDVGVFKIRIILKDRLAGLAGRQQTKNVCDRNAQAANAGTAMHSIGIDRYSFQKVWNGRHHIL